MSKSLFKEGGQHNIKRTGKDEYEMKISIPPDADGRIARECPDKICSPGYFKVKSGTGIVEKQIKAYCPYCRKFDEPDNFATKEQIIYATDSAMQEVHRGVDNIVKKSLGLDSRGKKKINGGLISIEMKYSPGKYPKARKPLEEILKRDIICPFCSLDHSVFGLATWCPDCGNDIFLSHVSAEFDVIIKMMDDIKRRENEFGVRVATKDIENALEDVVSIFEAVFKIMIRRYFAEKGNSQEEIDKIFKKNIRNKFQNVNATIDLLKEIIGIDLNELIEPDKLERINNIFQKRHPITHNLGIVDKVYLERIKYGEIEGRDIRVTEKEIKDSIEIAFNIFESFYKTLIKN